jgi:hypothetical protein
LVNFGIQKELFSLEQMRQLTKYIGGMMVVYIEEKKKIHSNSLWYKTKRKRKKWLLTDATEIAMALDSGTSLSLNEIKEILTQMGLGLGMKVDSIMKQVQNAKDNQ